MGAVEITLIAFIAAMLLIAAASLVRLLRPGRRVRSLKQTLKF